MIECKRQKVEFLSTVFTRKPEPLKLEWGGDKGSKKEEQDRD